MSCYHPLSGWPVESSGKLQYHPLGSYSPDLKRVDPRIIPIPCGRCVGCRLDYSRAWADRMMLELETAGCAVFITFTYDNDHVSYCCWDDTGELAGLTLNKRDWQLFMKRLRKAFPDRQLTFYASGEYGEHTHRPHMHAIVFGLSLDDFSDRKIKGKNELGQIYYISDRLTKIWQNGFTMLCDVSWKTCAYVSRYVMKKIVEDAEYLVECTDLVPEFALMSRRPAIGRRYLDAHPDCLDFSAISVRGKEEPIRLPKYYLDRLSLTDPEKFAKIKEERKHFVSDRLLLKLQQTDLSFLELMEVEENSMLARTASLKRSVE